MNNTKTIFKSLLIMIVAISLFTVSCSKDEGGSKSTDPTPITITANDINQALTFANLSVGTVATISTTGSPNVSTSTDIAVSAKAAANISAEEFATALKDIVSRLSISGATVATKGEIDTSSLKSKQTPMSVSLDITPSGKNVFDKALQNKVNKGKLTITLKITPDKNWG